ncbi:hypothetical protein D3C76_1520350 [compost metagenome]
MVALVAAGCKRFGVPGQAADNWHDVAAGGERQQVNAVNRAGRHAQVAARAFGADHGVHQLGRADDGVHRAGLDAFGAANAFGFANIGDLRRCMAALVIKFDHRHIQ